MSLPTSGLHDRIPETEYHGDPRSLSSTGAKTILSEGAYVYKYRRDNPEHKDVFDFGSVVHALILDVGDYQVLPHDSYRTKAAQEAKQQAREAGLTPILEPDYTRAEAVRDAVLANDVAWSLLTEGRPEVSAWATDPNTGVLMRGRFDYLRDDAIVDLKTTSKGISPTTWAKTVWDYRYGLQAVWYEKLLEFNEEEMRPFIWVVVSTQAPYEVGLFQPTTRLLDYGEADMRTALTIYAEASHTEHWPHLTDPHDIIEIDPPAWVK